MSDRILGGGWSDGREQELVRKFFGGRRSGFFVEVGANRPASRRRPGTSSSPAGAAF